MCGVSALASSILGLGYHMKMESGGDALTVIITLDGFVKGREFSRVQDFLVPVAEFVFLGSQSVVVDAAEGGLATTASEGLHERCREQLQ
jgi:hypothetical protein